MPSGCRREGQVAHTNTCVFLIAAAAAAATRELNRTGNTGGAIYRTEQTLLQEEMQNPMREKKLFY